MHKHKKAIIGVVFILVFAISFITVPQAFAVETKVEEFDTAEKYGLYIDKVSDNRYEVVMDEAAAGDKKAGKGADKKEAPKLKEVKDTIIDNLVAKKQAEDTNLLYKALISLREENKIEFSDTVMKEKYETYCEQYK
mgnify:CR=1 FL=1